MAIGQITNVDFRINMPIYNIPQPKGKVEITFNGGREKATLLEAICDWFNRNGLTEISAPEIGKESVALRINVPKLEYQNGWENVSKQDLDKCFTTIVKMVDLARMLNDVHMFLSDEVNVE